jgi:hypothetical protein
MAESEASNGAVEPARFSIEAADRLPAAFIAQLCADRPDLEAKPGAVRAWLRSKLPKMRESGYRNLRRVTASFWSRATRAELVLAVEREQLVCARQQARASPRPAKFDVPGLPAEMFAVATIGGNRDQN